MRYDVEFKPAAAGSMTGDVLLKIKPEIWTKNDGEQFVVLTLADFEKVQEAIEDAGLSRILRKAKAREANAATLSLGEVKRRLGMRPRRTQAGKRKGR